MHALLLILWVLGAWLPRVAFWHVGSLARCFHALLVSTLGVRRVASMRCFLAPWVSGALLPPVAWRCARFHCTKPVLPGPEAHETAGRRADCQGACLRAAPRRGAARPASLHETSAPRTRGSHYCRETRGLPRSLPTRRAARRRGAPGFAARNQCSQDPRLTGLQGDARIAKEGLQRIASTHCF